MSFLQGLCIFSIILLSNGLTFANLTPEQKAEAVRSVREGQSVAEVARELNTSQQNVRNWVRDEEQRTGQQIVPPQQHFTPEQKAEAVQLARETQNFSEVARKLNTSSKNVHNWVRAEEQRTGQQIVPQRQQQHFTPEQKAEAVRLVREGQTVAEVAREFNASRQNVHNWVRAEEQRTGQQIVLQRQQHFTPEEKAEAVLISQRRSNCCRCGKRTQYQSAKCSKVGSR